MQKINILEDLNYSKEKVQITPLLKTSTTKEVRIVFTKNQVMKKHKTNFPITVQIVQGEIDFGVNEEVFNLLKGDIVYLEANVPHDLKANEDSIVRLSLSISDSVTRVNGVLKL